MVELRDDGRVILKAYASLDGKKLRVVFHELAERGQLTVQVDLHVIDLWRSPVEAKRQLHTRHPRYASSRV